MAEVQGSAQDSGVETEGDQESNDSSMSSASVNQQPQQQLGHAAAVDGMADIFLPPSNGSLGGSDSTPEPSTSSGIVASAAIASSVADDPDGYLGDCSSDGGNEKNFPIPADKIRRLASKACACHPAEETWPPSAAASSSSRLPPPPPPPRLDSVDQPRVPPVDDFDGVEPPAGLTFSNLQPGFLSSSSCGYQVLLHRAEIENEPGSFAASSGSTSRKMRSSLKSRFVHHHAGSWSHLKASIMERKVRMAANTNNTEMLTRLLVSGNVNINEADEHKRTALHFASAKGYADVVRLLLQHGADPNLKDALGNTALHLAACTNHIEVVTLLLRAGTNVATLDKYGRTPMQLAQSKLKILQRSSNSGNAEMSKVKAEVAQVLEMMREYLTKTGHDYVDLLNNFSARLTLHQTHQDIHSDLQSLLDSLGNLTLKKEN